MESSLPITLASVVVAYYREHRLFSLDQHFGDRVGIQVRYGDRLGEWKPGTRALVIRPSGGDPDIYTARDAGRLEYRIYGPTPEDCDEEFALMLRDLQDFERTLVSGEAVLQKLALESSPSFLQDPDVGLPMYMFFVNAAVRTESALAD